MLNKKDKTQLTKVRKLVSTELKQRNLKGISVHCDYRTKKVKFVYSVYEDRGITIHNERKVRKSQKDYYLKNINIYDTHILSINLPSYLDDISKIQKISIKQVGDDTSTLNHWSYIYLNQPTRRGNISISAESIKSDRMALLPLIEYIEKHEPRMMDVWKWVDEGRSFLVSYMKYKQTIYKYRPTGKGWNDTTVQTRYRRIRAFFNWLSENIDGYPSDFLNRMPFTPTSVKLITFTPQEIEKIKKFIHVEKDEKEWGWFVPMFLLMLETGVRISELCNMKINDIEPTKRLWVFKGKGKFGGKTRSQRIPDSVWDMMKDKVVDEQGVLRIDKEYVFHRDYYKSLSVPGDKWKHIVAIDKPIGVWRYRIKFDEMLKYLKINKDLTPHSCRRYFITQMLIKSGGNIPQVAELVGHSSWDMVKHYAQSVITEDTETNIGLLNTASVPLLITKDMRKQLDEMGYTKKKISSLKPEQAHEIIKRGF